MGMRVRVCASPSSLMPQPERVMERTARPAAAQARRQEATARQAVVLSWRLHRNRCSSGLEVSARSCCRYLWGKALWGSTAGGVMVRWCQAPLSGRAGYMHAWGCGGERANGTACLPCRLVYQPRHKTGPGKMISRMHGPKPFGWQAGRNGQRYHKTPTKILYVKTTPYRAHSCALPHRAEGPVNPRAASPVHCRVAAWGQLDGGRRRQRAGGGADRRLYGAAAAHAGSAVRHGQLPEYCLWGMQSAHLARAGGQRLALGRDGRYLAGAGARRKRGGYGRRTCELGEGT